MGQPRALRRQNRRQITALILREPLTRPQLADRTGLSKVTVNAVVQELQDLQLVTLTGGTPQALGRTPQLVTLHPALGQAAGLDLQPGRVRYHLATLGGQTVTQGEAAVTGDLNAELATLLARLTAQGPLCSAVFGVPAPVDHEGRVAEPNALPELLSDQLRGELSAAGTAVHFENDANLAALAVSSRCPESRFLAVLLDRQSATGLGLLHNGELSRGAGGRAGEVGRSPWPVPSGHDAVEQLPAAARSAATAFALATLAYSLDLQHIVIGGAAAGRTLLGLTTPLLPAGVHAVVDPTCGDLVRDGAVIRAVEAGRAAILARLDAVDRRERESHVA